MRINCASHHSFIDVNRVDDSTWGPMIEIEHQHPECQIKHKFVLSRDAARQLVDLLNTVLPWLEPAPLPSG